MIIENLYGSIIKTYFKESSRVNILSGYGSGAFLQHVIEECPRLKIDLYLGMTQEGISKSSHDIFQDITRGNENINVYYQIEGAPNHMKIYSVFEDEILKKSFVGSANFTENGFVNNKEILLKSDIDFKEVFETQSINSLICTDIDIEKYVNIYRESLSDYEEVDKPQESVTSVGVGDERFNPGLSKLISMRNKASVKYYKEFDIEVVKSNDENWRFTGINTALYGGVPHITLGNTLYLKKVFPKGAEFTIVTEDDKEYKVRTSAKDRNALYFVDINIYEYFRNMLGLEEERPISSKDLKAIESNQMKFIRLDELRYYTEFY